MIGTISPHFSRILVIDDEEISRFVTQIMLEKMQASQQVFTASNGKEALALIEKYCIQEGVASKDCPDLVLLDLNMPIMDGFAFLDALQALGHSHLIETGVVVLTSSFHQGDKERIAAYGVKEYLTKPITMEQIQGLLKLGNR